MKKIIKALIFVVLLGITIITSVVGISKFEASELNVDEILINADFPQETIEKLSSYTKAELAKQILESDGFEYKIMTLNEVESMVTRGQIPDDDLTIIITTIINKVENGAVKEIKVKVYYEWTDLPVWRLEDPIVVQWDATKFSYQEGSFYSEDRYERDGDHLHISRTGYYDRNQDSFCWYADLKAGYFLGIGGTISKLYGFGELILNVKDEHQLYGTSFIKTTYVHSKISVEMGISFYGEIGVEIPKTSNDQVTTDILFNWSTPLVLTPADYVFEQQYFFYEKPTDDLTFAGMMGVYKEKLKTFDNAFDICLSAIKATNMGMISALRFLDENKELSKGIKEYIIKVIDDYGIIINKLKEFLLQEYR